MNLIACPQQMSVSAPPAARTAARCESITASSRRQLQQARACRKREHRSHAARTTSPACGTAMLKSAACRACRAVASHRSVHAAAAASSQLCTYRDARLPCRACLLATLKARMHAFDMNIFPAARGAQVRGHWRRPCGRRHGVAPAAARHHGAAGARGAVRSRRQESNLSATLEPAAWTYVRLANLGPRLHWDGFE